MCVRSCHWNQRSLQPSSRPELCSGEGLWMSDEEGVALLPFLAKEKSIWRLWWSCMEGWSQLAVILAASELASQGSWWCPQKYVAWVTLFAFLGQCLMLCSLRHMFGYPFSILSKDKPGKGGNLGKDTTVHVCEKEQGGALSWWV